MYLFSYFKFKSLGQKVNIYKYLQYDIFTCLKLWQSGVITTTTNNFTPDKYFSKVSVLSY